ncbi:cytochrome c biogenesis protein CcsA [Dendrosporobacter sp. 1207_IL3150]|uniref:cytochrome c biogenesis protein CcsA n=1 Tax=Dendrosporobacter sp. 1207_IL3150 TaxID=3084054 RepID=UPI002FD965B1
MIGYIGVALALIVSLVASGIYYIAENNNNTSRKNVHKIANLSYIISVGLLGIAAFYLFYIILNDKFEYAYVYGYSSLTLPIAYKISAFWAGQEGSFMLWAIFHAIFGLIIMRNSEVLPKVMTVFSLIQAFLLLFILMKSPFMMLTENNLDGIGLNPLLQDFWMIIHPPIIFLGYAALAVPFSYAVNGILIGNHKSWLTYATPWVLFALSTIGAGMFIGGFWAYKVLGWGGYWAWDPVENSSLVPWLATAALVHMLTLAKVRVGAIRHSYVLTFCSFILVLYGTFLTRSGVLSDFSTHSFADEGVGGLLGVTVLLFTFISFTLYISKYHTIPSGNLYEKASSREFILSFTALTLVFVGLLVFVGMSTPLVTKAFGAPKSLGTDFYNNSTLPVAAAIAGALLISIFISWNGIETLGAKTYGLIVVGMLLGLATASYLKLTQPLIILTVCLSFGVLAANIYAIKKQKMSYAAVCSHIGVAVLLIGIMASGAGNKTTNITFTEGQEQSVFGEKISFIGTEVSTNEIYTNFKVGTNGTIVGALTKLNKLGNPAAREPGIYRNLLADIYIAPAHDESEHTGEELTLTKNQVLTKDNVILKFIKFKMRGMDGSEPVRVEALIEVSEGRQIEEIRPELTNQDGAILGSTVMAFKRYEIHIIGIKPGEGKVIVEFRDILAAANAEQRRLEAEVSYKPLINLVWLGTCLITFGAGWAAISRVTNKRQSLEMGQSPIAGTNNKAQ